MLEAKWISIFIVIFNSLYTLVEMKLDLDIGLFPKAAALSDTELILLNNEKGQKMDDQFQLTDITDLNANLKTDKFSNFFKLNENCFILVKDVPLRIFSIYKENFKTPKELKTTLSYSGNHPYQYAIISDTQFLISFENKVAKYTEKTGTVTLTKNVTFAGTDGFSCDYSDTLKVILCAYLQGNDFKYGPYSVNIASVGTDIILKNSEHFPRVKLIKEDIFAVCYNDQFENLMCIRVVAIDRAGKFTMESSTPKHILDNIDTRSYNTDIFVFSGNMFVVTKSGQNFNFIHLSPSLAILGTPNAIGSNLSSHYPFLFKFGPNMIGYTYHSSGLSYINEFYFPHCKDEEAETHASGNGVFTFDPFLLHDQDGLVPDIVFTELPSNALLLQNGNLVQPGIQYPDFKFDFNVLSTPGTAVWHFGGINGNEVSTLQTCKFTLTICYSLCNSCNKIIGTDDDHKCQGCIDDYCFKDGGTENCYDSKSLMEGYYYDAVDDLFKVCDPSCENCSGSSTACGKCAATFYPKIGSDDCLAAEPEGYFLDIEAGVFRPCHERCKTCSNIGTDDKQNCLECKDATNEFKIPQCLDECVDQMFYMENNQRFCLDACPDTYPLTIKDTKECAKSCSPNFNPECVPCQEEILCENVDDKLCLLTCPENYTVNYTDHICYKDPEIKPPGPIEPEKPGPDSPRLKLLIKDSFENCSLPDTTKSIEYYFYLENETQFNNSAHVDLILYCEGSPYSVVFFKINDTSVVPNIYDKFNIVNLDFSSIIEDIKTEEYTFVMQMNFARQNEPTNQVEYLFFDSKKEILTQLLADIQGKPIDVISPITDATKLDIQNSIAMASKDIDIYNQSTPFYNDICFKFTTDNNRDITIEDRQLTYFPKKEICELNCNYTSIDLVNEKITCKCPFKSNTAFNIEIRENPLAPSFPKKNYENYNVVKCIKTVFLLENLLKNISFWVFLIFCAIIVVMAFCFICSGLTYANKYILEVLRSSKQLNTNDTVFANPPRSKDGKSSSFSDDDSYHTQIEEDIFEDAQSYGNAKRGKAKLNQNYIYKKKSNTHHGGEKGNKEVDIRASKLRDALAEDNDDNSVDLHKYYFTRNSENEMNPRFSKKIGDLVDETKKTESNERNDVNIDNKLFLFDETEIDKNKSEIPKKAKKNKAILTEQIRVNNKEEIDNERFLKSNIDFHRNNFLSSCRTDVISNNNKTKSKTPINQPVSERGKLMMQPKSKDKPVSKTSCIFCRRYFNYLKRREIFFMTFCSNKSYLPFFITFPIFFFLISLMFTINALFFSNKYIHLRWIEEGSISINYWIQNELLNSIYVGLIGNLVKIVIVKILIFYVFRIEKKMINKQNYPVILKKLRYRSAIIFVILILLMGVLFYINTCYGGIFVNTEIALYIGYAVSVGISFLVAIILCFIISLIRAIGDSCKSA